MGEIVMTKLCLAAAALACAAPLAAQPAAPDPVATVDAEAARLERLGAKKLTLGSKMLFASQCVVLIHHELDTQGLPD